MKLLKQFLVLCCMVYTTSCGVMQLASCRSITPPDPPPPPPAPVVTGHYIIREFNQNGTLLRMWLTDNYKETAFPRSISFTADGQKTTLRGSYEVVRTNQ